MGAKAPSFTLDRPVADGLGTGHVMRWFRFRDGLGFQWRLRCRVHMLFRYEAQWKSWETGVYLCLISYVFESRHWLLFLSIPLDMSYSNFFYLDSAHIPPNLRIGGLKIFQLPWASKAIHIITMALAIFKNLNTG